MPFSAGGVPLYLVFATVALILGVLTFKPVPTLTPVPAGETPALATAPVRAPTRPLTLAVPSAIGRTPAASGILSPTATVTPTMTPTVTLTPTVTVTPTASITPTVAVTPTMSITPTATVTPTVVDAPRAVVIPTETIAPVLGTGQSDLAFHPEHLNAGGVCKVTYSASGSLKNHGPGLATGVEIGYQVVSGAQWVDRVEVVPSSWAELGTSKPGRFTVYVHTNDDWASAGKGTEIVVRLDVQEGVQATFTVRSQCQAEQPDKPDKSDKPDKPKKNKDAGLSDGPNDWAWLLSRSEV